MRQSQVFNRWTTAWSNAFEIVKNKTTFSRTDSKSISKLIKEARKVQKLPRSYVRDLAKEAERVGTGWRSKNDPEGTLKGEQGIEAPLLEAVDVQVKSIKGETIGTATFNSQQVYLMSNQGQVKPDLVGSFCFKNKKTHIVSYEVKVDANTCGYALVECCRQVDILRRSPKKVAAFAKAGTTTRSAWGAVIAPPSYYKDMAGFAKAIEATNQLEDTELRVAFLTWDSKNKVLIYQGGNWL